MGRCIMYLKVEETKRLLTMDKESVKQELTKLILESNLTKAKSLLSLNNELKLAYGFCLDQVEIRDFKEAIVEKELSI